MPGIKAAMPEYAEVHSQVLQDVVLRVDRAYQAFFRRAKAGETAGYPRFQGRNRYHSFTYPQYDNGARLDNGALVLSKIGRIAVRWSRPLEGTPKTVTISHEADGWYAIISCADVPTQPLPSTGRETGIDMGLKVFLITADGEVVGNPRLHRRGEKKLKKAQRRVSRRKKGSKRRGKAVGWLGKQHQTVKRQRADFHHKTALMLLRQYDTIYLEELRVANMVRNHHLAKSIRTRAGRNSGPSSTPRQRAPGVGLSLCHPPIPRRTVAAVGSACPRVLSVRTHVCTNCGLVLDRDENAAQQHPMGRAGPSGTRGVACGGEPSIPRLQPWGVSTAFACIVEKELVAFGRRRRARRCDQRRNCVRRNDRERVNLQAAGTGWPGGF